jgi:hypothetical protein
MNAGLQVLAEGRNAHWCATGGIAHHPCLHMLREGGEAQGDRTWQVSRWERNRVHSTASRRHPLIFVILLFRVQKLVQYLVGKNTSSTVHMWETSSLAMWSSFYTTSIYFTLALSSCLVK